MEQTISEALLESLMKLFALLTDIKTESKTGRARFLVEDFLGRHFNTEYVQQYLEKFDEFLARYHAHIDSGNQELLEKQSSDNQTRILNICNQINQELEQEPKIILFVQLLDFLKKEDTISEEEHYFVDLLAENLKIDAQDYDNLKTFILESPEAVEDKGSLLYISGDKDAPDPRVKNIYNPKQQVIVWVLRVRSTKTFIFRYSGSRNLYLNGHKVEQNRTYILAVGAVIKTSRMPPVYYGRVAEKFIHRIDKARIIYRAVDVSYKFNNNQIGIHRFSFTGRSGQLVGIMGGSGTGKSTLLNVLNGNYKLSNGKISLNGYDLHADKEHLEGVIGYVPQDDLLKEELTVFENLYFNARLCFSDQSREEILRRVDNALQDFDLVEARDLVVGNPLNKILSGGQRKRLNIALELIREPSVLFVDEPTSGLSSMDSEKVMSLLKRQVLKGKLVIINIHQPSSDLYKMLDKLLMIDKGGYIIFNGNPMDAIVYFKKMANYVNPEERECYVCGNVKSEQVLRIVEARMVNPYGKLIRKRKVKPEEWYRYYLENFESKFQWKSKRKMDRKEPLPDNLYNIPNRRRQFWIYTLRDGLSKLKDRQYMLINFLEVPVLALILSFFTKYLVGTGGDASAYVFAGNVNIPAYLFMAVVVSLFIGMNVSAEEIIKDRKLLQRESFLNLSRFSFLNSKILILFAISALQTLMFVLVGNSILEIKGLTWSYWLILFSTACFANMLGLNISSGLNSVVAIYVLIPLILVPHLLFSGVIVNFDKLHKSIANERFVPRIGDVMVSRWSYEALAVNQFKNNDFDALFFDAEQEMSNNSYYATTLIPELLTSLEAAKWSARRNDDEQQMVYQQKVYIAIEQLHESFPDLLPSEGVPAADEPWSEEILHRAEKVLVDARDFFNREYQRYSRQRNAIMEDLIEEYGSSEDVLAFKEDYHNEALSDVVLNKKNVEQFVFSDGKMVRKKHPGYMVPEGDWGRAHFYSPSKKLGNLNISTPWFNMLVVWMGVGVLYVTLYLDVLRRVIRYFETFKLRRLNRRLQKLGT
ncbi:ATP-binding cassette domain-containing protein [Marinilabilia salmonicolor]|uniref:ABC-type multidrug transport system ATPase subunit n=1 Tax=Marinilabilia salmonicolor TaxID=989 RepID=A0A368VIH3_9BACT|nr:ATP-binding cassette domain-containing protein [Marinilabilia salmonicolor]RCW39454.1 ABC-type multidrug transport system ATPase subunit [Marinilabilia salmonicolor]